MPSGAVNYLAGLAGIRARAFYAAVALGSLPKTIAYVTLGGALSDPLSARGAFAVALYVAAAAGGALVARRLVRSRPVAAYLRAARVTSRDHAGSITNRRRLRMGYDVDVNATRFSNYLHVLRELVHLSCGHLALEPRFEVKALLGDHLHDDARAVSKLHRRLYELRTPSDYPGAPSEELAAVLDRANDADTSEYLEIAYGELKPTLIAALRIHLAGLDPLVDEPSLRLLTQLLHRQERHVAELPAERDQAAFEDLGALPLRLRRGARRCGSWSRSTGRRATPSSRSPTPAPGTPPRSRSASSTA